MIESPAILPPMSADPQFTAASRQDAFESITNEARRAGILPFCAEGVGIMYCPQGSRVAAIWDELVGKARSSDVLKFCAHGVAVIAFSPSTTNISGAAL